MNTVYKTIICTEPCFFGMRLDKFLFKQFPDYSRAYFQNLIDTGYITVNGRTSKSNYSIKEADQINIIFKIKSYNLDPVRIDFEIIDEHEDFVVINKPAGLLVHSTATTPEEISMVNGLLYRYQSFDQFEAKERPGIVHRLDKNTSGIIIVARNQKAHNELTQLFKDRKIKKTYLAVVEMHPEKKGTIDAPIGRHPTERHKMAVFGIESRQALTHYQTLAYYDNSALIAAHIVTGRTHQIRVHCASVGHGIVGDATYGRSSHLIGRQALHAWKMAFEFQGKQFSYTCPIPEDFKELVRTLSKER